MYILRHLDPEATEQPIIGAFSAGELATAIQSQVNAMTVVDELEIDDRRDHEVGDMYFASISKQTGKMLNSGKLSYQTYLRHRTQIYIVDGKDIIHVKSPISIGHAEQVAQEKYQEWVAMQKRPKGQVQAS